MRERDVVLAHDVADVLPQRVHEVLLVVVEHPLGEQAAAAADDADEAPADERQVLAEHAGVDREVVDALLRLVLERLEDEALVEVFDLAPDDHRVDRDGADRHGAVAHDRVAAGVEVAAGGEVHHRVGAPPFRPLQLLDLLVGAGADRRGADVRVDLRERRPADGHRVELVVQVVPVGRDDHPPGGHFVADLRRGEVRLAGRDAGHLRRDDAEAGVLELGDRLETRGRRHAARDAERIGEDAGGRARLAGRGRVAGRFIADDLDFPVVGQEVPRRLLARLRHAGRVGRAERPRRADPALVGERAGRRALGRARRVVAERREGVRAVRRSSSVSGACS